MEQRDYKYDNRLNSDRPEYFYGHSASSFRYPLSMDHSPLAEAKRTLGLDPDVSHLVVLGGSRINDFMDELVSMIYVGDDTDSEISIICGSDKRSYGNLTESLGHIETIHVYETPDTLSRILDSADLLLSEAHSIVASEASKRSLPLILADTGDPAQKELLETLVKKGCAASGHGDTSLAELCIALLSDEPRRVRMASCWEERKQT